MPHPTGKEWFRTHYKGICKAAKKRRGTHNRYSEKKSVTFKKLWKTKEYREKITKARKKQWKVHRKEMMEGRKKFGEGQTKRLKKLWANPTWRAKMMKVRKEQVTPEYVKKMRKGLKKRWADPKYYAKMCKIRKTQSKGNMMRQPNASFYRTKYKGIHSKFWMRSSWEVAFALWLDHCGIKWEYEKKKFCLSKGHYYTPDFYLPDQNEYVELKGWLTKRDEKKIARFRKKYPNVKLYVFGSKHMGQVLEFRPKRRVA